MVVVTLQCLPFDPLEDADVKLLFLKTAFLVAIASARRISETHALSVHIDEKGVIIWYNNAFLLKALSEFQLSQSVELQSAPTWGFNQEVAWHQAALCPVRAFADYVKLLSLLGKQTSCLSVFLNPSCPIRLWRNP